MYIIIPSGTLHNILCQPNYWRLKSFEAGLCFPNHDFIQATCIWWPPRRWGSQHWREAMEPLDVRTLVIYETPRHGQAVFGGMMTKDGGLGRWRDVRTSLDVGGLFGLKPLVHWCRIGAGRHKRVVKSFDFGSCLADGRMLFEWEVWTDETWWGYRSSVVQPFLRANLFLLGLDLNQNLGQTAGCRIC